MRADRLLVLLMLAGCAFDPRRSMRFATARSLPPPAPAAAGRVMAALPEVDAAASHAFEANKMPSLVTAVLLNGRVVWWRSYGARDNRSGGAVTSSTAYRIGSLTKVFTAMAVLRLRDEGRLDLDDPAAQYIPELSRVVYPTADSPVITIRHMLTHTSGLPRLGRFDYANSPAPITERQVLDALNGVVLDYTPGTSWEYSNFAYGLLGILVGRVAGERYRDYVSRTIFAPLGMHAVWDLSGILPQNRATGYERDGQVYRPGREWLFGASEGMGGIYASLDDLTKFVAFQMTAWPPGARPSAAPLSNASMREAQLMGGMQPPGRKGTGLGWGVADFSGIGPGVFHTGATATYAATMMFLLHEGIGFVAMTNCGQLADAIDGLGGNVVTLLARAAKGN